MHKKVFDIQNKYSQENQRSSSVQLKIPSFSGQVINPEIDQVKIAAPQSNICSTQSKQTSLFDLQNSKNNNDHLVAFIYDIPKKPEIFTNRSIEQFFALQGIEDCQIQIAKGNYFQKDTLKPFWSGKIKFKNEAQLNRACKEFKHFQISGFQLRLLSQDKNLMKIYQNPKDKMFQQHSQQILSNTGIESNCKPDNSIENCNMCVKGIPENMDEQEFEDYFTEKYGPVRSCKISKDPKTGQQRSYGFVWFEQGKDANMAMLDFVQGKSLFRIEWYKAIDQRKQMPRFKEDKGDSYEVQVSWRRIDNANDFFTLLSSDDLKKYFMKIGQIVKFNFFQEKQMAFIKFSSSDEANLAVSIPKIEIRGFRVWVKYNQSFNEFSEKNDLQQINSKKNFNFQENKNDQNELMNQLIKFAQNKDLQDQIMKLLNQSKI